MPSVAPSQRFRKGRPCPICGGHADKPRGKNVRCTGYLSKDGTAAFCSREEHAKTGQKPVDTPAGPAWVHQLDNGRAAGYGATYAEAAGRPNGAAPTAPAPPVGHEGRQPLHEAHRAADGTVARNAAVRRVDAGEAAIALHAADDEPPTNDATLDPEDKAFLFGPVVVPAAPNPLPVDRETPSGKHFREYAYYDLPHLVEDGPYPEWRIVGGDTLLAVKRRIDYPDGRDKEIRWKYPDGAAKPPKGKLLYRPAGWTAGRPTFILEGEKATQALAPVLAVLAKAGIPLNVCGTAGAKSTPDAETLNRACYPAGAILWGDNDEAGREQAEATAATLESLSLPVHWFEWPDAPPKGDAADFVQRHGDDAAKELLALLESEWCEERYAPPRPLRSAPGPRCIRASGLRPVGARPRSHLQARAARWRRAARERILPLVDAAEAGRDTVEWLVDNLLPLDSAAQLYGEPGSCKTHTALSLAEAVVTEQPWLGPSPTSWLGRAVAEGPVVYCVGEGLASVRQRWRTLRGRPGAAPQGRPLLFLPHAVNMDDPAALAVLLKAIEALAVPPRLIVIDTQARFSGGEENSPTEMGRFIAGLDELRRATGALVLALHHPAKSGGSRGATSLVGAFDTVLKLTARPGAAGRQALTLTVEKSRYVAADKPLKAVAEKVDAGEKDGEGRLITTLALRLATSDEAGAKPADAADAATRVVAVPANANQDKAYDVLAGLEASTSTDWENACLAADLPSVSAFDRARRELVNTGRVEKSGDGRGALYRPARQRDDAAPPVQRGLDGR